MDPLSINDALLTVCRQRGVVIREHEPVAEVLATEIGVCTTLGVYDADRVLLAAGAWSSTLFPGLPPVHPVRGHLLSFDMEPGLLKTVVRNGPPICCSASLVRAELNRRCRPELRNTNGSWRCDETCLRVTGKWTYLNRAVDSTGATIEFLLSARRDADAARRFFQKALRSPGHPRPRVINSALRAGG